MFLLSPDVCLYSTPVRKITKGFLISWWAELFEHSWSSPVTESLSGSRGEGEITATPFQWLPVTNLLHLGVRSCNTFGPVWIICITSDHSMQACAISATLHFCWAAGPSFFFSIKWLPSVRTLTWTRNWNPSLRTSNESGFLKCKCSALSNTLGRILRVGASKHEAVQVNGQIWTSYASFGKVLWWGAVIFHCWSCRDPWHTIGASAPAPIFNCTSWHLSPCSLFKKSLN